MNLWSGCWMCSAFASKGSVSPSTVRLLPMTCSPWTVTVPSRPQHDDYAVLRPVRPEAHRDRHVKSRESAAAPGAVSLPTACPVAEAAVTPGLRSSSRPRAQRRGPRRQELERAGIGDLAVEHQERGEAVAGVVDGVDTVTIAGGRFGDRHRGEAAGGVAGQQVVRRVGTPDP